MTQDGEPGNRFSEPNVGQSAPGSAPANRDKVLSYRGVAPVKSPRGATFERQGDVLTVTIPGASIALKIILRSILFLIFVLAGGAIVLSTLASLTSGGTDGGLGGAVCPSLIVMLLTLAALATLGSIIQLARDGALQSVVRVWPGGLEVNAPGATRAFVIRLPRAGISDVRIHPAGFGFTPRLRLEITGSDDQLYVAAIPWPRGYPMIVLEDNVRDVLGLAPDNQAGGIQDNNRSTSNET